MCLPEDPCLGSLKSYLIHHKQRKILEIKKQNKKPKEHTREVLTLVIVIVVEEILWIELTEKM